VIQVKIQYLAHSLLKAVEVAVVQDQSHQVVFQAAQVAAGQDQGLVQAVKDYNLINQEIQAITVLEILEAMAQELVVQAVAVQLQPAVMQVPQAVQAVMVNHTLLQTAHLQSSTQVVVEVVFTKIHQDQDQEVKVVAEEVLLQVQTAIQMLLLAQTEQPIEVAAEEALTVQHLQALAVKE